MPIFDAMMPDYYSFDIFAGHLLTRICLIFASHFRAAHYDAPFSDASPLMLLPPMPPIL